MKRGLLIINLGTPNSPTRRDVGRYLGQFLTDKRVLNLPAFIRYAFVYGFLIPFRSRKTTQSYQKIWTEQGSPLLFHSQNLMIELQNAISSEYKVALGMCYGNPSIANAIYELKDCEFIYVLPLYPQYSSAATGSALEKTMRILSTLEVIPSLYIIRDFYQHSAYIESEAQVIQSHLDKNSHLLFSYHGLPEYQIHLSGCKTLCSESCPTGNNNGCYKAQCYQTSRLLANKLGLNNDQYDTSFQSRLGKIPWIKPYTDTMLIKLAVKGVKNLTIACPSFVADCLETLEEIGMRAKEQWLALGGEHFTLIPCLNTNAQWINAVISITTETPSCLI